MLRTEQLASVRLSTEPAAADTHQAHGLSWNKHCMLTPSRQTGLEWALYTHRAHRLGWSWHSNSQTVWQRSRSQSAVRYTAFKLGWVKKNPIHNRAWTAGKLRIFNMWLIVWLCCELALIILTKNPSSRTNRVKGKRVDFYLKCRINTQMWVYYSPCYWHEVRSLMMSWLFTEVHLIYIQVIISLFIQSGLVCQ